MQVRLRPAQSKVFCSERRFRLLVAGRRFGKTQLALVELCRAAFDEARPQPVVWYVAPTYKQAKRIAWRRLKDLTRPFWSSRPHETDLTIALVGGGLISLRGADRYDSLRGEGLDFVVLDEYASMAPEAWTEVLRPALSDRLGRALFIGTPRGYNHFHELYEQARHQAEWASFQFTTEQGGNVAATELRSAAQQLDEKTFRQEYQASFENLTAGRAYYAFDRAQDVQPVRFDRRGRLCWSLDFNIDPAASVLAQVVEGRVHVLDEIVMRDANTYQVCEEFLRRTEAWVAGGSGPLPVAVYGDQTGDSRNSSSSRTDWQIVREFFTRHAERYQASYRIPSRNPEVKDRVNCVNAVICNAEQDRRLRVAPQCKQLQRDLEQVCWRTDANGNPLTQLDHSNPALTHVSDALGYLLAREFSMRPAIGEV